MTATSPADLARARQVVVDAFPDVTDPDVWPDMTRLPGGLLTVMDMLGADITAARLRGQDTTALVRMRDTVERTREAVITVWRMSPLAAWRTLHPEQYDPLDNVSDCGNPDCPSVGFRNAADRDLHHRRWGPR